MVGSSNPTVIVDCVQEICKSVLSGSDYLKLDGGWGFAQTPLGEPTVLSQTT